MVKRNRGYKFAAEVADGVENDVLTVAETTHWDPVETAATRPLAFVDHSGDVPVTYFYTHDLTKNICEVLDVSGAIVTAYDYTPFGAVTASNTATPNTVTFSSEVLDAETALVYYNYRHYNPADGRWINRDPIDEQGGLNLYAMVGNGMGNSMDYRGEISFGNIWDKINSIFPKQLTALSMTIPLGVWPVPVMPIVTVEAYLHANVRISECCDKSNNIGYCMSGSIIFEISGGVGTSIGGTSGKKAYREKTRNNKDVIRYRDESGRYTNKKKKLDTSPPSWAISTMRPPCPPSGRELNIVISVGISGIVSAGRGWASIGATFDTKFGECRIPGDCTFLNPLKNSDAKIVTGQGAGARIAVYGAAELQVEHTLT